MRNLLYRLTNRLPCRIISDNGEPYLERYYVCSLGRTRIYLHRFVGSDPDRGLHSHPWSWALSIILSGWYFEERFSGTETPFIRRVRRLNFLLGESFHRVVMPKDKIKRDIETGYVLAYMGTGFIKPLETAPTECWTLFIHRAQDRGRRWGFLRTAPVLNPVTEEPRLAFTPYTYPGGGTSSGQWWTLVPKGRDEPRRKPL